MPITPITKRISGSPSQSATKRIGASVSQQATKTSSLISIRADVADAVLLESRHYLHFEEGADYLELE